MSLKEFNIEKIFISTCLIIWVILQLLFNSIIKIDDIYLRDIHVFFLIFLSGLIYKKENKFIKFLISIISLFVFSYLLINYKVIAQRGGYTYSFDLFIAFLAILIVIFIGFRVNKNLTFLAIFFLSYLYWGKFLPEGIGHTGFSIKRILNYMFWGTQGIFGIGIGVSATYIFMFVLFGSFLKFSGFSNFINDISLSLVGKSRGGPAKVAIIASALMGMINGSAIANVVTTGTITIPMMKETGYDENFSAAVEAASSTGGQFCPPIMGAAAFVMAEFLQIPYYKVMVSAIIPSFLFYFGLMVCVSLEAIRLDLSPSNKKVDFKKLLREKFQLALPILLLLILMFKGYSPIYASGIGIISVVFVSFFNRETKMGLRKILKASLEGASSAISVGVSCILIGLIIGSVSLSGLGLNFGDMVLNLIGHTNIFLGAIMVMIMSVILGMGLPGVAAYVIVVAVSVPVMVKLGVSPLAAHLFCLIYACLSNITPPVAISSYVASSIAKGSMYKTSMNALKIGISGFIIPFFFINEPALIFASNDTLLSLRVIGGAIIGVYGICVGVIGFYKKNLNLIKRILLILGGVLLINPSIITDIFGVVIIISCLFTERKI